MVNKALRVKLGDLVLDNPIIPASGTFGFGFDHKDFYDLNILGTICTKAITLKPRYGNELPRIAEIPSGMINAIGLQNNGVDHIIQHELPYMKKIFHKKIIANVAGETIEEYVAIIEKLESQAMIAIYEINVSCPNVDKGCMKFDEEPQSLTLLIKAIKKVTNKSIFIKLSPRVTDIVLMAKAAEAAGANGLTLINTMPGMRIDLKTAKPIVANKVGGCSGAMLKPIALRAIYLCAKNVKIPIMGCGGVETAEDVIEMMYAGATAVQVGSANLINPVVCQKIIHSLHNIMDKHKINKLQSIIGLAIKQ